MESIYEYSRDTTFSNEARLFGFFTKPYWKPDDSTLINALGFDSPNIDGFEENLSTGMGGLESFFRIGDWSDTCTEPHHPGKIIGSNYFKLPQFMELKCAFRCFIHLKK